ncbi:TIM barrel protein [Silvibacterium bohemicum]|uniref:TIM barrel protein n=1 Tax=Silvibacterium bohemicum TaxID=1577686 RepID=UPI00067861E1|nr:TIM barrel protein [Silvibacterium bohemicum]
MSHLNNHSGSAHGDTERVFQALDSFRIELPSWGFSNTGTRFGKFVQPAAATNLEEKFADAGQVNALTGASPTVALHVLWDTPNGVKDAAEVRSLETKYGVRAGSINPNLFQDQKYKFGSLANPSAEIRQQAVAHCIESVEVAKALDSRDISMWISDGANYPGSQSIRRRIDWLQESLKTIHDALRPDQRMLVEYKPFEPAFYFTDVADWGMALEYARSAGPQAKVLVDTGHHYQAQNVEQIVAWLLHLKALGGFHFNDRKYADDDLTLGSIDPYQVFRIFYEIVSGAGDQLNDIAFMIDQSHNLKGKVEAMVQTVVAAQELYAKAALVDQAKLAGLQDECRLVEAEELFRGAFYTDVRPAVAQWRVTRGLPHDPLKTLYESGYVERAAKQRAAKNAGSVSSYA